MDRDTIYVNVDPVFNCSLDVFDELIQENQLTKTHGQQASLDPIRSAKGNDIFYGENASDKQRADAFGRTASSAFRMAMLCAVQIPKRIWPKVRSEMNKDKLQFKILPTSDKRDLTEFKLIDKEGDDLKSRAERICAEYDRVFPPSFIKGKMLGEAGASVEFQGVMLVFRYNNDRLTQVIEILTKAAATKQNNSSSIASNVKVTCTCYKYLGGDPDPIKSKQKKLLSKGVEKTKESDEKAAEREQNAQEKKESDEKVAERKQNARETKESDEKVAEREQNARETKESDEKAAERKQNAQETKESDKKAAERKKNSLVCILF